MYISHSLLASAAILSFSTCIDARVTQQGPNAAHQGILQRWPLNKVFGKRQEMSIFSDPACPTDDPYIEILDSGPSTAVQVLCNELLAIPPATTTIEYVSTITNSTTNTTTWTETLQILTTQTVTDTATITPVAVLKRAAAKFAVADGIVAEIAESGTDALAFVTLSPNANTQEALLGLRNACSCETVAPLTVTLTNTASTQGNATSTHITSGSIQTTNPSASPLGSAAINGSSTAALIPPFFNSTSSAAVPASITSPPLITLIASGSVPPVSTPTAQSGPSVPVVIGIPFECPKGGVQDPKANGLNPQFIVGDLRYEYSVLCDTAIEDTNLIFALPNVANETACAAECSLVNHVAQRQLCKSAAFVPNAGASDGQCFLHGVASRFVSAPGTVTILLTGVSSKADKCQSVDVIDGPGNSTVDTAQLVEEVVAAGFSFSTPGLVTRFATGGVSETFYLSDSTRSDGWVFYTWYKLGASSTAWWAIYESSWACTAKMTLVPALATSGGMVFTTAYSTATLNATAGGGAQGPSPTVSPEAVVNQTPVIPLGTGFTVLTVSGGAVTSSFTEGGGSIPPIATGSTVVLSGSAVLSVSGTNLTFNATEGSGGQPGPTLVSGKNAFSTAGGLSTGYSTGGSGSIPPLPTNGTFSNTLASAVASDNSLFSASSGAETVILSSATTTKFVVGGAGYGRPARSTGAIPPLANATLPASVSATPIQTLNSSVATGTGVFIASGETAVLSVASGNGAIPPPPNSTLTGTAPASSGALNFSLSGGTTILWSTGTGGAIPPSANLTTSAPASLTASPSTAPEDDFSNPLKDRTGGLRRSSSRPTPIGTAPLATAPIVTGSPQPVANSTAPPPPPILPYGGYGVQTSSAASFSLNITAPASTGQPSVTLPPLSANSSTVFPTASGTTGGASSNDEDDRRRRSRSSSPIISGTAPALTSNITLSDTAPVPTANVSMPGAAPPVVASIPLIAAPSGTGPSSIPTTGNFSASEGPRRGSVSSSPANSTAFLATGTAPVGSIPPAANSSVPIGTASVPLFTSPSSAPAPFANVSAPLSTGETTSGSFQAAAANSSLAVGTGTGSIPASSANSTSLFPIASSAPSSVPTLSANSSAEDCPTATALLTIPHTTVITTVFYETVSPSTCESTASGPLTLLTLNVTLPTGTGIGFSIGTAASTDSTPTPSATATIRSYRRSGEIATQEQIDQACADPSNMVVNSDFSLDPTNAAFGWTVKPDDDTIMFRTQSSLNTNSGTTQSARVLAAAPGRSLTLSQPLTLCPGKQYKLTSFNRQANLLAKCTVEYLIGDDSVYGAPVSPQEVCLQREAVFTAGSTNEEVSKDLRIRAKCDGEGGVPAGANAEGWMVLDVDDVGVQQV